MSEFSGAMERAKQLSKCSVSAMLEIEEIASKESESKQAAAVKAAEKAAAADTVSKIKGDDTKKAEAQRQRTIADKLTKEALDMNSIAEEASAAVQSVRKVSILLDAFIPVKDADNRDRSPLREIKNESQAHVRGNQPIKKEEGSSRESNSGSQLRQPIIVSSDEDESTGAGSQANNDLIQVFIKLYGKLCTIRIATEATVGQLIGRIEEIRGIPANQQRILFGGQQLEEGRTLKSYQINQNSTLQFLVRLRGD